MKYYTRNFHNNILPYYLLDEFTIYDEASIYNDDFYERLAKKRDEELKSYGIKSSIYSRPYTGNAVKLLSILPASIELPDIRSFFLYAISPENHAYITDLNKKQDAMIKEKRQEIENRYNEDKKLVPEHWLILYDIINWPDSSLEFIEIKENEITLIAEMGYSCRVILHLKNISNVYMENEYDPISRIIFVEVLYEDTKLVLNILTDPNEYSFTAEDVSITIDETEKF